jgi:hypothetical protein
MLDFANAASSRLAAIAEKGSPHSAPFHSVETTDRQEFNLMTQLHFLAPAVGIEPTTN